MNKLPEDILKIMNDNIDYLLEPVDFNKKEDFNKDKEKYYLCFDVGLTGYFSIIKYIKNNFFEVIHSEKIQIEEKENFLYKTDKNKKSKAIVKNQVSFKLNYERIKYLLKKYNINNNDCLAFLEQLTPRPFHSKVSILSLGDTGGTCRSICDALNLKYLIIPPKTWKDGIGVTSEKETSIKFFKNNIKIKEEVKSFFGTKNLNHNQIESVLIAFWYYKLN